LGTIDIAEATSAQGIEIERSEVRLPDGPLRSVGEFDIEIHLHTDINVSIRVNVVGDYDGEPPLLDDEDQEDAEPGQEEAQE
ncbi:MAG: 50S ribosomal L9 C-terminal domain-containing protein, partial [Gammaproteobacteria bacterium]